MSYISASKQPIERLRVHIVEPDARTRRMFRDIFGGSSVHEDVDGAGALSTLQTHTPLPHITFIDRRAPMLDGIDFTKIMRSGKDSPDPLHPIVILGEEHNEQHIREAIANGVTHYLIKPISVDSIMRETHRMLSRREVTFIHTSRYFGPVRTTDKCAGLRAFDLSHVARETRRDAIAQLEPPCLIRVPPITAQPQMAYAGVM